MAGVGAAGDILTAAAANAFLVPQWHVAITTGSTSATAETIALTSPSHTYVAGGAYVLRVSGLINGAAGSTKASLSIRDTNTAGTQRMIEYGVPCSATLGNIGFSLLHWVANTGGANITGRVLVLTHTGVGGNVQVNAATTIPAVFECFYVGLSTDFPSAVAL